MTTYMPANAMFEFPDGEIVSGDSNDGTPRMKQGHICCGSCCDTRRAVIIVDIVMVTLLTLFTILAVLGYELIELAAMQDSASEDTIEQAEELKKNGHIGLVALYHIIQIAAYSTALQGAVKFNRQFILAGLAVYLFSFGVNFIMMDVLGMILTASFAYPHYYLAKEIQDNIMTPENYPNEVYSCCCT